MKFRSGHAPFHKLFLVAALVVAGLSVGSAAAAAQAVKCVGEQSTMTSHIAVPLQWPALLGTKLGASYTVTNDGDNMGTVLTGYTAAGAHAFTSSALYTDSKTAPNIVVVGPWAMHDEIAILGGAMAANFQTAYDSLISSYLALTPKPIVIVMTAFLKPTDAGPTFTTYQNDAATLALVSGTINPAVHAVAAKYSLPIIDVATQFTTIADLAGDGGLTQAGGHPKLAGLVYAQILSVTADGGGSSGVSSGASSGAGSGASTSGSAGGSGASTSGNSGTSGAGTGGSGASTGASSGSSTGAGGTGTSVGSGASASGAAGTDAGSGGSSSGADMTLGAPGKSGCAIGLGTGPGGGAGVLSLLGLALLAVRKRSGHRN